MRTSDRLAVRLGSILSIVVAAWGLAAVAVVPFGVVGGAFAAVLAPGLRDCRFARPRVGPMAQDRSRRNRDQHPCSSCVRRRDRLRRVLRVTAFAPPLAASEREARLLDSGAESVAGPLAFTPRAREIVEDASSDSTWYLRGYTCIRTGTSNISTPVRRIPPRSSGGLISL